MHVNLPPEVWAAIPDWVGYYEASNLGRIRSVPRVLCRPHPKNPDKEQCRPYGGKLLSPKQAKNGYLLVQLFRDNRGSMRSIHRLVLSAFTGHEEKQMDVNHINGDRTDNRLGNLEWATRQENLHHAADTLGSEMCWQRNKRLSQERKSSLS